MTRLDQQLLTDCRTALRRRTTPPRESRTPRLSRVFAVFLGACVAVLSIGCDADRKTPETQTPISRTATGPGVSVTLTASTTEVVSNAPVRVRLEVLADASAQVGIENYGRALTEGDRPFQYRVVSSKEDVAQPTPEGRRKWVYTYDLEFVLPDQYEVPAATVTVAASGQTADAEPTELKTEPLPITVKPATPLAPEDLEKIRVLDPRELPGILSRWWWVLAIAAILLILVIGRYRRQRRELAERVIIVPAHEWAYRELGQLASDRLVEQGRIQDYFYRISGIVRGYVERRFAVMAPEMTTEEFLATMSRDPRFAQDHRRELARFMSECDLVKYARYEASRNECDAVAGAARTYVDQTKDGVAPATATIESPGTGRSSMGSNGRAAV